MARQPSIPAVRWYGPLLAVLVSFGGVVLVGGALLTLTESRRPPLPTPAPQDASAPANRIALEPKASPPAESVLPIRSSEAIRRAFHGQAIDWESFSGEEDAPSQARPALWKLSDADTTIYLFGTIHTLRPGLYWFDAVLQRAFAASNELVVEAFETDPMKATQQLLSRAIDRDGPPLSKKLSPDVARRYRTAMARLGLSINDFERLEPWFVSMFLANIILQQFGYGSGVDDALVDRAIAAGKPVISLETMDFQLSIFDQMPERRQISLLNDTITALDRPPTDLQRITFLWATGQAEALADGMEETARTMPDHYNALITKRNRRWTTWLINRLDRPGTVFVAVGGAHFAGEDSVLRMLRARHLKVTRLR